MARDGSARSSTAWSGAARPGPARVQCTVRTLAHMSARTHAHTHAYTHARTRYRRYAEVVVELNQHGNTRTHETDEGEPLIYGATVPWAIPPTMPALVVALRGRQCLDVNTTWISTLLCRHHHFEASVS